MPQDEDMPDISKAILDVISTPDHQFTQEEIHDLARKLNLSAHDVVRVMLAYVELSNPKQFREFWP